MAVTAGSQMPPRITRPYVYRGTGEDQFPETREWGGDPKPKPSRAELVEKRRHRAAKRRTEAERLRIEDKRAAGWKPGDEGRATMARRRAEQAAEREARRQERLAHAPRAAPGWKPLAGADLDALLDEID